MSINFLKIIFSPESIIRMCCWLQLCRTTNQCPASNFGGGKTAEVTVVSVNDFMFYIQRNSAEQSAPNRKFDAVPILNN